MTNKENAPSGDGSSAIATALRLLQNRKQLPPIEQVNRHNAQPLSYAQELLWLFQQVHPESTTYNLVHAFQLRGPLNVSVLEKTLNEIVRRHTILRTTYHLGDEQPLQRIEPYCYRPLPVIDLRLCSGHEQDVEIGNHVQAEGKRPFHLSQDLPIRLSLFQLQDDEFVLVICLHHIAYEVSSERVLFHEMAVLYQAFYAEEPSPLAELPIQYADYAVWQRQTLTDDSLAEKIKFYQQLLGDELPTLDLPTDYPRSNQRDFTCKTLIMPVSPELHRTLRQFSQLQGTSIFNILLAIFYIILYRYTGQEKIVVGTPVNGRNQAPLNKLLGIFVNEIPLPVTLTGQLTFNQLLQRVQQTTQDAYTHPDLPFHKLFQQLSGQQGRDYFSVTFNMPAGRNELQLAGLTVKRLPLHRVHSQADLFVTVLPNRDELSLQLTYQANLFSETQMAQFVAHYQNLLAAVLEPTIGAERPISQLAMLTQAEQQQIVHEWNDTATDFGEPQTIHALFEQQVERTPNSVAVAFRDMQLTYAELNTRANQLAHHLIERGVQANTLIAIAMESSLEMVVSLLAVLKAGGAYVPIDPAYPPERIRYMLTDSAAPILLTQSHLPSVHEINSDNLQLIAIDTIWAQLADQPIQNPQPRASLDDLIYVIYTSGSTGQPKGAGVYHRGFHNLLNWFINEFTLDRNDSVLLISSPSFDLTQKNIFAPLLVGGELHLIEAYDPKRFVELIARHHISWINCTPSAFYPLIEQTNSLHQLQSLRYVFLGGEPIALARLQHWLNDESIHTQVVNTYGPTECTDICAAYTIPQDATEGIVPIGRPIHNVQLFILDASLQPTPIKTSGELYIGGAGLGKGYLNRPDLTAERFIEHPEFGRLYKTGDLCRWLPDGNIEYIGRTDFQVKVRGFRIELGEIESALLAQDGVQEAAVLVRERRDTGGDQRLVAYVVGNAEGATLRQQLAQRLPEYMVPTHFVTLNELPLTPSGKLNRRALPEPDYATAQTTFVAPRNPLEQQIAALWGAILNVKQIGINDNFFELGGHSLLAARLSNALQNQLHEIIHITAIFEAPTVAQLADYLHRHYPKATAQLGEGGQQTALETKTGETGSPTIDEMAVAKAQAAFLHFSSPTKPTHPQFKNKPATFIFSAPRTGSTLLRVILAGHPALFAPPELGLLGFQTLSERRASKREANQSLLDGPVYALQESANLDLAAARSLMQHFEERQLTIAQFYDELQTRLGERRLVDKTPTYTFNLSTLHQAEQIFADNRYLFLVRHPYGMIHSFDEARLDLVWPQELRQQLNYTRLQLAELIWLLSYRNIQAFAAEIPAARQHWIRFEDLVTQPETTVAAICDFLQIEFQPKMLHPYTEPKQRMTAGATESSRMLGDVKFHQHTTIDASIADTWRQTYQTDFLSDLTWQIAKSFDYAPIQRVPSLNRLQTIQRISPVAQPQVKVEQLSDQAVANQLQALLAKRLAQGK